MENSPGSEFFVGSTHEGAEGMFQEIPQEEKRETDVTRERKEKGILEDAQSRFDETIKDRNWEFVKDPVNYPSLDEWVDFRIANNRGTKFYPCFVQDPNGNIIFIKTQLSDNPDELASLQNEANFLGTNQAIPGLPKFIEYHPPQQGKLSYLALEAIPFSEGRVAKAEEWSAAHAVSAAKQIKSIEGQDLISLTTIREKTGLPGFEKEPDTAEFLRGALERSKGYLPPEFQAQITELANQGSIRQVLAHGDACLKNIIIKNGGDVLFVDWEFAGKGFLGQDAAKLFIGLKNNEEAKKAFLETYLVKNDGNIDDERLAGLKTGMVVENLMHLLWRVEIRIPDSQRKIKEYEEDQMLSPDQEKKLVSEAKAEMDVSQKKIKDYTANIIEILNTSNETHPINKYLPSTSK
jgi:thiamine kinase-like enzyme